ncbi:MAG TPA: hypothetical protein PKH77_24950 [Anaerolineae bacterium]|nr:hypothetical protein [Anaerolineae bacterium]
MKYYPAHWWTYILKIVGSIMLLFGFVLLLLTIWGSLRCLYLFIVSDYDLQFLLSQGGLFFGFFTVFFVLGGAILPNLAPDFATDEQGIYVKFYWQWLLVPWKDVASFNEAWNSILNPLPSKKKTYFLLAKPGYLTPFHWLVSFNQFGGWGPGCLVGDFVENHEELIRTIRAHIPDPRHSKPQEGNNK